MHLRDPERLALFMRANGLRQAELARTAGVSRQFIHMLLHGGKRSCTPDVGRRIEEGLRVLPGTIFTPERRPSADRVAR